MKNKQQAPHKTPEIPTDPSHKYILLCLCCSTETGETMALRSSLADPVELFGPDPAKWKLRKGFCSKCEDKLKQGMTIYYSDTRGVILDFRGTHWHITEDQMDAVLTEVAPVSGEKKETIAVDNEPKP